MAAATNGSVSVISFPAGGGALRAGAAIVNAQGIPGTLGCFGLTLDDQRFVFITSAHVLFGAGASEQDVVRIAVDNHQCPWRRAARARHGRCGTVCYEGSNVYVDCAAAELDRRLVQDDRPVEPEKTELTLSRGDCVSKVGAVTGRTDGVVVDTNCSDTVRVEGRRRATPGQILVRPTVRGDLFSTDGDSGAMLRNGSGAVVGVLWGVDARGYGLACPIAPVLWVLHVRLVQFAQQEMA